MTIRFIARAAVFLLLSVQSVAYAQFKHPGTLHSAEELQFLKAEKLGARGQWADFNAQADAAYNAPLPVPVSEFYCGRVLQGQATSPACKSMRTDGFRAYTLALQWYFTEDERYAKRSLDIIRLWQREFCGIRGSLISAGANDGNCKGGTFVDNPAQSGLEASWIAAHFVNAAEILRHANPARSLWTANDTAEFNRFLARLLKEMNERGDGASYSNAVWSEIEAKIGIAIFQDDQAAFDNAIDLWNQRIKQSIYLRRDGSQPNHVPVRAGRALVHDWNFPARFDTGLMDNGVQAETCRDLNHADMAFKGQTYSAHMAFNQGVDLFSAHRERISSFMELHNGMRNGLISSEVCKNPTLWYAANRVLADAENLRSNTDRQNGTAYAITIKAVRNDLKWTRSDISVQAGESQTYRAALSAVGGAQNSSAWLDLLTQQVHENNFDRNLRHVATIADIAFWQEWPNRRPKCYGGSSSELAYPCGRNGEDVDIWHLAFSHMSYRLGLELPASRTTIETYAANGPFAPSKQFIGVSKWEGLGGIGRELFGTSFNNWLAGSPRVAQRNEDAETQLPDVPLNDDGGVDNAAPPPPVLSPGECRVN